MTKLSGEKVKIDLTGSIGLGRIDGNRLYGPGDGVVVPVELAKALGRAGTPVKPEESAKPSETASTGGSSAATTSTFKVKLENDNVLTLEAGAPTAGFPVEAGKIDDHTVADLENEIQARKIELPEGKGSGASGGYLKGDLVTILEGTTPKT